MLLVNWNSNPFETYWSQFIKSVVYLTSAQNCPIVGQRIIDELVKKNFNFNNAIHCIGHSLGILKKTFF